MPKNNELQPIELPMELKFYMPSQTAFYNNLRALEVELVDAPTTNQARNVAWHYVKATWADDPHEIDPSTAPENIKSSNIIFFITNCLTHLVLPRKQFYQFHTVEVYNYPAS